MEYNVYSLLRLLRPISYMKVNRMPEIIRISLDAKFNDYSGSVFDDDRIEPISIGMCNIDMKTPNFYAVSSEFNEQAAMGNKRIDPRILKNIAEEDRYKRGDILAMAIYYFDTQIHLSHNAKTIELWSQNPEAAERSLNSLFQGTGKMSDVLKHMGMHSVEYKNVTDVTKIIAPVNPSPFFGERGAQHALRDALIQSEMFRWAESEQKFAQKHKIRGFIKRSLTRMSGLRPF